MKKFNIISAVLVAGAVLGTGAAVASNDPAAAGRILGVDGSVLIQRTLQTDIASAGSIIGVGDSVLTTDTGTTQWTMADDSLFALAPNSGLKINNYVMPSSTNGAGIASYVLLNGAVHTITGRIGKTAAANAPRSIYTASTGRFNAANLIKVIAAPSAPYTLKTAMAIVTTKGADYAAAQNGKSLEVLVNAGSVTVCTIAGCASPAAGEGVVVNCEGCKPTIVPGITLALNALNSNVAFNLRDPALVNAKVNDPRANPPSPSQGCSTIAAQLQNATSCGPGGGSSGPGVPVSPN